MGAVLGGFGNNFSCAGTVFGEVVEDVLDGGGEGLGGLGSEAGGGDVGRGEEYTLGVGTGRVEMDLGGEVLVADLSGFEGFEFDVICV